MNTKSKTALDSAKIRSMTVTALGAAIICVLAPWKIPVGAIPFTLATFAVYLVSAIIGSKKASVATIVYILLGSFGVPVFSGFAGGFHVVAGVTGGYIVGYILIALSVGLFSERFKGSWKYPVGMVIGTVLLYTCGTAWYCIAADSALLPALAACVLPFIGIDTVKIIAASFLASRIRPAVEKML